MAYVTVYSNTFDTVTEQSSIGSGPDMSEIAFRQSHQWAKYNTRTWWDDGTDTGHALNRIVPDAVSFENGRMVFTSTPITLRDGYKTVAPMVQISPGRYDDKLDFNYGYTQIDEIFYSVPGVEYGPWFGPNLFITDNGTGLIGAHRYEQLMAEGSRGNAFAGSYINAYLPEGDPKRDVGTIVLTPEQMGFATTADVMITTKLWLGAEGGVTVEKGLAGGPLHVVFHDMNPAFTPNDEGLAMLIQNGTPAGSPYENVVTKTAYGNIVMAKAPIVTYNGQTYLLDEVTHRLDLDRHAPGSIKVHADGNITVSDSKFAGAPGGRVLLTEVIDFTSHIGSQLRGDGIDLQYLLIAAPGVAAEAARIGMPYAQYAKLWYDQDGWRQGYNPNPMVDSDYVVAQAAKHGGLMGMTPLDWQMYVGEPLYQSDPNAHFDVSDYASRNGVTGMLASTHYQRTDQQFDYGW